MRKTAMYLTAVFVAMGLTVYGQIPVRRGVPTPRPTPKPTPTPRPTPVVTPDRAIVMPLGTPRPITAPEDRGTTLKIRVNKPLFVSTPATGWDGGRRPRIRVNSDVVRPTDGSARPPLHVPTPGARVLEDTRDPAMVFVARVGDEELSMKELQRRVTLLLSGRSFSGPKEQVDATKAKLERTYRGLILADWIDTHVLVREAQARGIEVSDKEIDEYIQRTAEDRQVRGSIAQRMEKLRLSEKQLRKTMADAILCDKLVRRVIHERIPDSELRQRFDNMPELFVAPPARHVWQIIYPSKGTETPTELREMDSKMQKIRRSLRWFGSKFEDFANPSGTEPIFVHDLGWLEVSDQTIPERQFLYYIIFALAPTGPGGQPEYKLKINEISDVIQSPYGFHIFKVTEDRPAARRSFEEARIQIEDLFYNKVHDQLVEELKIKYQPRYSFDGLSESAPGGAGSAQPPVRPRAARAERIGRPTEAGNRVSSPSIGFGLELPPVAPNLLNFPKSKR